MVRVVVFDLGGVLVRIARSWAEAASTHSIAIRDEVAGQDFGEFAPFLDFQAGRLELAPYVTALAEFLGTTEADALHVHNGILIRPYDGTDVIVDELRAAGILTGCLSNTNAPHWETMSNPELFRGPASLAAPGLSHVLKAEKPHAEIYQAYEKLIRHDASEILFFDDLLANVEGARNCGWSAERIDPTTETEPQIRHFLREYL
jgi:glucose-1-phosphatase